MKTDTFALMTPAGTQIVGTVDTIPASAAVSGFYEDDDGRLIAEYVGDTNVYWDCQETAEACGQPILMDENGAEWLERECLRVPIGADGEPLEAHSPGPWKAIGGDDDPFGAAVLGDKEAIAEVYKYEYAKLIAAAPDLLGALQEAEDLISSVFATLDEPETLRYVRETITKATGSHR